MIVKCERCQTRFKIPDEKVTDKGVKVRCTKCQNTFRVKKSPEAAAPPAPSEADPFSRFGTAPDPASDEATRPYPPGSTLPPTPPFDAQKSVPTEAFERSTPVGSPPVAREARREVASALRHRGPPERTHAAKTSLLGDVPTPSAEFASAGDFEPDDSGPAGLSGTDARAELFEMPARPAAPAPSPAEERPAPPPVALVAPSPAELDKPARRPDDAGTGVRAGPGVFRRFGGLAVNLAVAAALMIIFAAAGTAYLTGGKLDRSAFSLDRVKATFAEPKALVARDVTNGLYETQSGRPVLFVRGRVENHGKGRGKGKIRAEILEGVALVRAAEGYAGSVATSEDLYLIASSSDVDALNARSAAAAVELAPGAGAEFLLAFYEYPPEVGSFRVKVSVIEEGAKETAAR